MNMVICFFARSNWFMTCLAALLFNSSAFAFNCYKANKEIVKDLKTIEDFTIYGNDYKKRRLQSANEKLANRLARYAKNADSIHCDFSSLKASGLFVATSKDKRFRAFSWDTKRNGSRHHYSGIMQYITKAGTPFVRYKPSFGIVTNIFQLNLAKSSVRYLLVTTKVNSSKLNAQTVQMFQEKSGRLQSAHLVKSSSGLDDALEFEYDFFSVYKTHEERPIQLVQFDSAKNMLKIPVVTYSGKSKAGKVTDKFVNYKFNGFYFEKVD